MQILDQGEGHVAQQIAFVKFIEKDNPHLTQGSIILKPAQENAFRDKTNPRAEAGLIIKTDLIPYLLPQGELRSHATRAATVRAATRRGCSTTIFLSPANPASRQHLRHLGGFSRAGGRYKHEPIAVAQGADN